MMTIVGKLLLDYSNLTYPLAKAPTLVTGVQLASRGRRDMSSRVKDVVMGLSLCHNVSLAKFLVSANHD